MNITGFTLAKALRTKKTISQVLATVTQRAMKNLVVTENQKIDFDPLEQLGLYLENQQNLRQLKTSVAAKSLSAKVKVPANDPDGLLVLAEAGQDIPVYQAVLLRDDLKGYRAILQRMIDTPANNRETYDRKTGELVEVPVSRKFDFTKTLKLVEIVQDKIDEIDGAIQYADATVKF